MKFCIILVVGLASIVAASKGSSGHESSKGNQSVDAQAESDESADPHFAETSGEGGNGAVGAEESNNSEVNSYFYDFNELDSDYMTN